MKLLIVQFYQNSSHFSCSPQHPKFYSSIKVRDQVAQQTVLGMISHCASHMKSKEVFTLSNTTLSVDHLVYTQTSNTCQLCKPAIIRLTTTENVKIQT
jgi:hypothetical protein